MHVNLPEKLYYTIGEVSKAFDVNTSLVRFWEKEFDILKPKKNSKGTRRYSAVDIDNFQTIHHLVKEKAIYTTSLCGGDGAFREAVDWIVICQGRYEEGIQLMKNSLLSK